MTVSLNIQIETAERKYAEAAGWLEVQREMIEELKSRRFASAIMNLIGR